jgi:hypothetical protein
MKIIITIKNNYELEKADKKRYEKQIKKAKRKLDRVDYTRFFGKSKIDLSVIDLSVNEPCDATVEIITRNVEAAKKMFLYYKTFDCIRTSVRFESEIVKEDENT